MPDQELKQGKAVLISIQPQWCELIASGKKTVEVRKTAPEMPTPFKCYIYCTNTKPFLVWGDVFRGGSFDNEFTHLSGYNRKEAEKIWDLFNGKVMGEFVCDKVFDICIEMSSPDDLPGYPFPCTGLTDKEILQYLGNGKTGYGWHISELKIYDKPKDLSELYKPGTLSNSDFEFQLYDGSGDPTRRSYTSYLLTRKIRRPPQSWCYVEEV